MLIGTIVLLAIAASAQRADPQLPTFIDAIRAVDNHAHVVAPDPEHDTGYDALPCDALPPGASLPPANLRFNSGVLSAWKAHFDGQGAAPVLLTSALNDPALRGTTFVLLHGGGPDERTLSSLIAKPNVYAETSFLEFVWSPHEMARILRPWLEVMPEHVIFGTDAGPFGPGTGWEETTWLGSRRARQAVAIALSQMVADGVITAARAREIASGVLRDNAAKLYRLDVR